MGDADELSDLARLERQLAAARAEALQAKSVLDDARVGYLVERREDGVVLDLNTAARVYLGCSIGESCRDVLTTALAERGGVEPWRELRADGNLWEVRVWLETTEGQRIRCALTARAVQHLGEAAILYTVRDATREFVAEERLRLITEVLPVGVGVTKLDGTIVYSNEAGARQQGVPRAELLGKRSLDLFEDPADRDRVIEILSENGRVDGFETWWKRQDGTRRRMRISSQPLVFEGEPCIMGIAIDITDQYESQAYLRAVAESTPIALSISRREDGSMRFVNRAVCRLLGASEAELLGTKTPSLYADAQARERVMAKLDRQGEVRKEEMEIQAPGGRRFWAQLSLTPVTLGGEPHLVAAILDIDEARRNRIALKQSLEENTVLLQELRHRVRNNLEVISSLLRLQIRRQAHPEARRALEENQGRVDAMNTVHSLLVPEVSGLSKLNLQQYVKHLLEALRSSWGPMAGAVTFEFEVEPIKLGLEQSVPFGLILHELLTNTVKHAFPEGKGQVSVTLRQADDVLRLEVSDSGVGLAGPEGPATLPERLGLQLVTALTKQLDGELGFSKSELGGLRASVRFPFPTRHRE